MDNESGALPSDRATAAEPEVSALRDGIPSAVRQLLADIARLASDYEIGDDIDREDLGAYFEWRNCMDLADAYGRGVEQQYFDEIASAYGLPVQGMETRQGGDAQQAPSHCDDSPVANGDAPTPTPEPNHE